MKSVSEDDKESQNNGKTVRQRTYVVRLAQSLRRWAPAGFVERHVAAVLLQNSIKADTGCAKLPPVYSYHRSIPEAD